MEGTERKVTIIMKYAATLNGKQYEVELERIDDYAPIPRFGAAAPAAPAPIQMAAPAPAAAPVPAPAVSAPAAPAPAAPSAGGVTVEAPMPGKILEIKAAVGQTVKFGQVILTMEAMKMETEIVAPADGTISQVVVKAGDAVDTGASLVILG